MRKRRTRQHQIEDLSYNFVEKQVLDAFCIFRRYAGREYGYDADIETFNKRGEPDSGVIFVQVKATEHLKFNKKHGGYGLPLVKKDLDLWLDEIYPVLVVLYDAVSEKGYFTELHEYFKENRLILKNLKSSKTIYMKPDNHFTPKVIEHFRKIKNLKHAEIKKL